jgi:hypothetical protein
VRSSQKSQYDINIDLTPVPYYHGLKIGVLL